MPYAALGSDAGLAGEGVPYRVHRTPADRTYAGAHDPPQLHEPMTRGTMHLLTGLTTAAACVLATEARAAAPASWPPAAGSGQLFAHIGEEHLTDADGPRVLPAVVAELAKYRPAAVMSSADKSDNGTPQKLEDYKRAVIAPLRSAGIPVYSATGNHDRTATAPVPGGSPGVTDGAAYRAVFADQPFPWGDAAPAAGLGAARPAGDPAGASTHYAVDTALARWIFVDNSCYAIGACDAFQNPPFPDSRGSAGQLDWMSAQAAEARAQGRRVFVVMHMPTQDDRPGHSEPTPQPHTMGEGTSPDNAAFEQRAAQVGVDGVFLGHIKVMQQYSASSVRYFIDGGAGGELYVNPTESVGVDSGYWYGYRLIRVDGSGISSDAVPVIVPDGITVSGPASVRRGQSASFAATARQPASEGVRVEALALRDPDPSRPNAAKLPRPTRIWTTSDPLVLAPLAEADDDPRRDPAAQTISGRFTGVCPGSANITVTSGFASRTRQASVASLPGPVARSVAPRARTLVAGRSTKLAAVRLAQPARLIITVHRGRRTIGTIVRKCAVTRRPIAVRWDGRLSGRRVGRGSYTVAVRVASDRPSLVRRYRLRVR